MTDIGINVKDLRKEENLSQKQLAEQIHIAQNTLSQIETNTANPSIDVLIALADFFAVSTDYLLGRSDDFGNVTVRTAGAQLTSDEERLLKTYRNLTEKNKMHVSAYAQVRLEEQDGGSPNKQSTLRWK